MDNMIAFSVAFLDALASFLASEPIFYLWCLILALFIVRIFKALV